MNDMSDFRSRIRVGPVWGMFLALVVATGGPAGAQQFNGDNQWVAPHGVGTFVLTIGQEYSTIMAVAALLPETEFNLGVTHFVEKPLDLTEGHYSGIFYVKRRLSENEAGTGGWAVMGGTGVYPGYLSAGEVTDSLQSWWANAVYTIPFRDGTVTWDLLPGFLVNLDKDRTGQDAWGMTYSSRAAVYKVIPRSAIVGEVFGTTGEAYAEPTWRLGVRWESPRVIVAATYGDSFSSGGGPRFEIGVLVLTNQLKFLCLGKCRKDPGW
jgi:hypothetical protein